MDKIFIISSVVIIILALVLILLLWWRKHSTLRKFKNINDYDSFNYLLKPYGFSYDKNKDLFYSNHDAWQRDKGYCRLYDEAAAPMSMIIDCEPIYFEYDNKRWLIQFWKGQYGMTTGVEIGVYNTTRPDMNTEYFKGTFYDAVSDDELLDMSFTLLKNGRTVMRRRAKHWWLTGFKLGEFSQPDQLVAYLDIHLKDTPMRNAFLKGLLEAGYRYDELTIIGNTVVLTFDKPRTAQPYTRTKLTDEISQQKNKALCLHYQDVTKGYATMLDKIQAVQENDPKLLQNLLSIGKTQDLFKIRIR